MVVGCNELPSELLSTISVFLVYLSLPLTRQDLTQCQWPEGWFIVGVKGGGDWAQAEAWALLVYVGHRFTDEPCWTWIQMQVQAWMPDYSLNWTKRSSAIQCLSMTSSLTRRWPSWNQEPFSLQSAYFWPCKVNTLT